tara:strand:- start:212 stop:814 length:603 start_codon:yes stop_codon:yes gene_type:complete
MMPFDCYKIYLALKNHFTKDSYDYHKYNGRTRATVETFYKRKDRFWFEKMCRKKTEKEVEDFFVANFVSCSDPETLWIGDLMKSGDSNYTEWKKRVQSLSYIFKEEVESHISGNNFDTMFFIKGGRHPQLLKEHLQGHLSLETMLILDRILGYKNNFDKKLDDPVWKVTSTRMKKYSPFLNIDVFTYKKILKGLILDTVK